MRRNRWPAVMLAAIALTLVAAGPASAKRDYVKLVDPWVEADIGRYFFFQSASQPFGMVKLRPDTSTETPWGTGYRKNESEVKGFSHLHDWQLSGIQVMPTSGPTVPKLQGEKGWQSHTEHDASEVAEPGYHKLMLDRYGIEAELTSTERVGVHRYTFERAGQGEILVNLAGVLGEAIMKDAHVTRVSDRRLRGWVRQRGGGYPSHDAQLQFDIRFDKPFDSMRGWSGSKLASGGEPIDELSGDQMGVFVRYDKLSAGDVVQMKVGLSLVDPEGATRNLETEAPGWDFDAIRSESQAEWNRMLGRVDVAGGTHQQQVKFYTDMFHVLCGRSVTSDVDGRYMDDTWNADRIARIPAGKDGAPKFAMYNYDALWLTQWNLNTMLGLAYPEIYSSFVQSQLQMYKDGGMLPRGAVAGNDSLVMTGSPGTNFITGAWNKGIRDFDPQLAYEAMRDAHAVGGLFEKSAFEYDGWSGIGGARDYLTRGYVPQELGGGPLNGGAGMTLEYAHQDWALAQFARRLKEKGFNVAQTARVSSSSQLDSGNNSRARAIDGRPARNGPAEWSSAGETQPWIQLDWDQPQTLRQVVLEDRLSTASNAGSGVLTFSDGSSVDVSGIPADGTRKVVDFAPREATWIRFQATGGSGLDVGLGEIEVYDDRDMGEYLTERSRNWRNLYDPSTGFIRPKNRDGSFMTPFDPLSPEDFVEANAWQATWFTSHDVMGLANLMGGEEVYADKLNFAFESAAPSNFIGDYGDGYVSYGNQPGLQMAHMFNYVGYPWLTQHWVREVKEKTYGATSTTDGYGHFDEDQGQMGAMSALMAIGLFEVTGGGLEKPVYDITSPVFDKVTIALDRDYYKGGRFQIVTHGASKENQYIQRARLDGKEQRNAWFRHEQLADGGTLQLWLGSKPNTSWGVDELPPSESASEHRKPVDAESIEISGPDKVEVPYESVHYDAAFAPEDASLKEAFWTVTAPDGSPTDLAKIDNAGKLTLGDRSGTVKVTATAADGGGATASKLVEIALDVGKLRSNAARWPGVTAKASSEFPGYPATRVFDGFEREAADWASKGEQNPWIELHWDHPIRADRVQLFDRTSLDEANGGTLTFSDGSSVEVSGLPKNGDGKTFTFPIREFEWVRFQVKGGTGPNVGLLEFEVYAEPGVPDRPARMSVERRSGEATVAWTPPSFDGGAPVTGYVVRTYRDGALAGEEQVGADARSKVVPAQEGDVFAVAARNLLGTGAEREEPVYATGVEVTGPDTISELNGTARYDAVITPENATYQDVTWSVGEPDGAPTEKAVIDDDGLLRVNSRSGQVRVTATSADGGPAEVRGSKLVEIAIDEAAIRENAARWPGVTATASSEFSATFGVDRVFDGFGAGSGDWASAGQQNPWVQLDWPAPVSADRIVLYDRTSGDDANGGTLTFSDGSTIEVTGIPGNGDAKTITFPMKELDSVRFQVTGGTGPNVGLLELEVYARPEG